MITEPTIETFFAIVAGVSVVYLLAVVGLLFLLAVVWRSIIRGQRERNS
jgi:hypothetical protein